MLFGCVDYWENYKDVLGEPPSSQDIVLLSYKREEFIRNFLQVPLTRAMARAMRRRANPSAADMESRLTNVLSRQIWGFAIHHHAHAVTDPGIKVGGGRRTYSSLITISIDKIQAILNPDLTLSERCMAQVDLTIAMVHELMHGIWEGRVKNDDYEGNVWKKTIPEGSPWRTEPYLDGEGFNECGYYMEKLFFGGVVELKPIVSEMEVGRDAPTLMFGFRDWPNPLYASIQTPANGSAHYLQDGALVQVYPVSSSWPSKLLAESFWNDQNYPNKSDNFFHRSPLFTSTTRLRVAQNNQRHLSRWTRVRASHLRDNAVRYPEDEDVMGDWNDQNNLWVHIRAPWYREASEEWRLSPWSSTDKRHHLVLFGDYFARKHHQECARISESFISSVDWTSGRRAYAVQMPDDGREDANQPQDWVWHCIGLLMAASLPLRGRTLYETSKPGREWTIEHAPSETASAAGHYGMIYTTPDNNQVKESSVEPSRFWEAARPDGRGRIQSFTQLDYLDSISHTINLIKRRRGLVYQGFLTAIINAKRSLDADRGRLVACYPGRGHTQRWASEWHFKLPEYDPTIVSYHPERGLWGRVVFHE